MKSTLPEIDLNPKIIQEEKSMIQNATVWVNHRPINAKTFFIAIAIVFAWIIPLFLLCWFSSSAFFYSKLGFLAIVAVSLFCPCALLLWPMHSYHLSALLETISVIQEDDQLWFFEISADSSPARSTSIVAGLGPTIGGAAATAVGTTASAIEAAQYKEYEMCVHSVNEIMAFHPHKIFKVESVDSIQLNRDHTVMNVCLSVKEGKHTRRCKLHLKDTYSKPLSGLESALYMLQQNK